MGNFLNFLVYKKENDMNKLLIKNGFVIDTLQNVNGIQDVNISNGHIVENSLCDIDSVVIDATDCYVFPGLIDFHTHLYDGSAFGINPDLLLACGVTTAVDAGSAGWINFKNFFNKTILQKMIHLRAFVNVSGVGMPGAGINEPLDMSAIDWNKLELLFERYKDVLVGLKIRISKSIVKEQGINPLINTFEFAHKRKIRVCVHVTDPVAPFEEILPLFQKGDIFCHVFQGDGYTLLDDQSNVIKEAWAARKRGVLFDACNGKTNFSYKIAKEALSQGFSPDIISSDQTTANFNLPQYVKCLPYVMSKYISMGMDLKDIIKATTEVPAKILGMEGKIGTLSLGANGDVTICKLINKNVSYKDAQGILHYGKQVLVPVMTILQGNIVYCNPAFN